MGLSRALNLASATFLAPIGAALLTAVGVIVLDEGANRVPPLQLVLFLAAIICIFAVPITASLGVLLHSMLLSAKRTGVANYALAGLPAGIGVVFLLSALDGRYYDWLILPGAFMGALTATFFWLIRRPDRDGAQASAPEAK